MLTSLSRVISHISRGTVNNSRQILRLHNQNQMSLSRLRYFSSESDVGKWTKDVLDRTVKESKIVVFMKGTPDQPMCGFSRAVMQILEMHGVSEFSTYNILEDQELRQKVKEYSNWPTVPQVYINGEFVGGCDIMIQMHQSGDLIEELQNIGIRSALLDRAEE